MITPKTTNCKECADIIPLIDDINCKIFNEALKQYNNISFGLNLHMNYSAIIDLLNYRRILMHRIVDPCYGGSASMGMIASKVKILTYQ